MQLTDIERDFVDFFSELNHEPRDTILKAYQEAKRTIDLAGKEYRDFTSRLNELYLPYLSDRTEASAIKAYQHFAYLDMLRFVSYSFPTHHRGRVARALKRVLQGDFSVFRNFLTAKKKS